MPVSTDTLRSLPKALLHDHLDGSLRLRTLLDLCTEHGLSAPAPDVAALAQWFERNAMAGSLERYLEGFGLTVAALASEAALERVAFEIAEDAAQEGCVLAEFRMAPLLLEAHGLSGEAALAAMLRGLARSRLPCGLIVCGMRHESADRVARAAALALQFRAEGVIGFDLAGPEAGFPATAHRHTLERVAQENLPITLHAGEADAAERVLEAVTLGARRIGHGVRLADWLGSPQGDAALRTLADAQVHLEVCPTSNVQTGAAASIAAHPIRALFDAGVSLSFHTDNRLISCTTLVREADLLVQEAGFTLPELVRMETDAIAASFLPAPARHTAHAALQQWVASTQP